MLQHPIVYIRHQGDVIQKMVLRVDEFRVGGEDKSDISSPIELGDGELIISKWDDNSIFVDISTTSDFVLFYQDERVKVLPLKLAPETSITVRNRHGETFEIGYQLEQNEGNSSAELPQSEIELIEITSPGSDQQRTTLFDSSDPDEQIIDAEIIDEDAGAIVVQTNLLPVQHGKRVGREYCRLCLKTLDPNDEDEAMCYFVIIDNKPYHRHCWVERMQRREDEAETYTVEPPTPLEIVQREAVLTVAGPTNSIYDSPLGISEGTIVLKASTPVTFHIRNNSDDVLYIPRFIGPTWLYVDLDGYQKVSDTLTIFPKKTHAVTIHPHIARPAWQNSNIEFSSRQYVLVTNEKFSPIFALSLLTIFAFSLLHWLAAIGWIWSSGDLLQMMITTGLVGGWIAFMMPTAGMWTLYSLLENVKQAPVLGKVQLIQEILSNGQQLIWQQFASGTILEVIGRLPYLFGIAFTTAIIIGIISLPLWAFFSVIFGVFYNLLGFLSRLIITLGYTAFFYYLLSLMMEQYGLQLWHRAMETIKALWQQLTNSR